MSSSIYSFDHSIHTAPYHALEASEKKEPSTLISIVINEDSPRPDSTPIPVLDRLRFSALMPASLSVGNHIQASVSFPYSGDDIHRLIGSFLNRSDLVAYASTSKYSYKLISKKSLERVVAERKANGHHRKFKWIMFSICTLTVPLNIYRTIFFIMNSHGLYYVSVNALNMGLDFFSWGMNVQCYKSSIRQFEKRRCVTLCTVIFCNFLPFILTMSIRASMNFAISYFRKPEFEPKEIYLKENYSYIPASLFFAHGSVLFARTLISRKRIINLYLPSAKKKSPNRCQWITSCVSACFKGCFQRCGFFKK